MQTNEQLDAVREVDLSKLEGSVMSGDSIDIEEESEDEDGESDPDRWSL